MLKYFAIIPLGVLALSCSSDEDSGFGGGFGPPPGTGSGATGATGMGATPGITVPGGGGVTPGGGGTGSGTSTEVPPGTIDELRKSSCAGWRAEPESLPSQLELIVDVSSSMNEKAPGSNASKWEVTRDALLDAVVGVTGAGLPASTAVGLLFYPNRRVTVSRTATDVTQCVNTDASIPIALLGGQGAQHRTLIGDSISDAELNQSTPTHDAYRWALQNVITPSNVPGKKFAVIITDGAPTLSLGCMNPSGQLTELDAQPIVEEVTAAAAQGIQTFLIGSPGSEPNREWMSQAAQIGGTAQPGCSNSGPNYCHIDLTTSSDFAGALRAGLAQIAGQVVSCAYDLPPPPPGQTLDPAQINIIYTPTAGASQAIGRNTTANCSTGWQFDGSQLTLCPETCTLIKQDQGARLELLFGCATLDVPVR